MAGEIFLPGSKPIFDSMLKEACKNNSKTKLDEMDRKEAIEIVRKNYPHVGFSGSEFETALRELVPEFKEQPDPRHSLIEFIKWSCDRGCITPEQRKNVDFWLAYLERQKKQTTKTDACGFPIRDKGESACSYLERCLAPDMRNIWYEACAEIKERQKDKRELDFAEGKVEGVRQTCQEIKDAMSLFEPKDLTPFEFTFRDYIDSAIRYCLFGEGYQQYIKEWAADLLNLERQGEQKLDFKYGCSFTDDELMITDFWKEYLKDSIIPGNKPTKEDIDFLLPIARKYFCLVMKEACTICKERSNGYQEGLEAGKHSIAEWSEEDEKMLTGIIERGSSQIPSHEPALCEEQMEWLMKRLRLPHPQSHWKPSEEQMDALKYALGKGGTYNKEALNSLLSDIQKLL